MVETRTSTTVYNFNSESYNSTLILSGKDSTMHITNSINCTYHKTQNKLTVLYNNIHCLMKSKIRPFTLILSNKYTSKYMKIKSQE